MTMPAVEDSRHALLARWTLRGYPAAIGARLLDRYAEPHRHHHTAAHLQHAFAVLDTDPQARAAVDRLSESDREAVELAVWYHDLEYDPRRTDNEVRSALQFIEDVVDLHLGAATRRRAVELILVSVDHRPAQGDAAAALFCDLDLAVFGDEPAQYDLYRSAIREEYTHVPSSRYSVGRRHVLEGFLRQPRVFGFTSDREPQARENLTRELRALEPERWLSRVLDAVKLWWLRLHSRVSRIGRRRRQEQAVRRETQARLLRRRALATAAWGEFEPTPHGFLFDLDDGRDEIRWDDIDEVAAYKKDCFGLDQIRMAILSGGCEYTLTENMTGWEWLIHELPNHLDGMRQPEEWFLEVAFPAFELCYTPLYSKTMPAAATAKGHSQQ